MAKTPSAHKNERAELLERLAALEERVRRLEAVSETAAAIAADFRVAGGAEGTGFVEGPSREAPAPSPVASPAPAPAPAPADATPISDEVLLVLSAAVAAFLGERAHVRQVRLVHSDAWAQQGRVSVMASHRWAVHR